MRAPASPQFRFLLRASSLFLVMLTIWWWLLLHPLLAGIRVTTGLVLHLVPGDSSVAEVAVAPSGDWLLRVPVPEMLAKQDSVQRAYGRVAGAPPVKVHSFRLTIAERIPTFFTLSFPLFWALVLGAPRSRRLVWVLVIGTGLLMLLSLLSLLLYIAFTIETNLKLLSSDLANLLWSAAEYLNINVVPYMSPLLLALWLHRELRAQILVWDAAVPVAPAEKKKVRQGK